MAKANRKSALARISRPANRAFQIRYIDPKTGTDARISVGSRDDSAAKKMLDDVTAKLQLGIDPKESPDGIDGMCWQEFRDRHTKLKQTSSKQDIELKLDICQRFLKARSVAEAIRPERLAQCQAAMFKAKKRNGDPLSPRSVASYLRTLKAALNWAYEMGYTSTKCDFKIKVNEQSKGRPLDAHEVEAVFLACQELRPRSFESWHFLLRGLRLSGLRLGESMNLSWDIPGTIQPKLLRGGHVALTIPASQQKNRKLQIIPTIPAFAELLESTPLEHRTGHVFNPGPERGQRVIRDCKRVGRVISAFGQKAGVIVNDGGGHATAHDLRRTFGQNMADAGMPPQDLQAIMRHKSFATTQRYYLQHDITRQAQRIAKVLGKSGTIAGTLPDSPVDPQQTESDLTREKP